MVIFSGGMDSSICLHWARKCYEEVHAITFTFDNSNEFELADAKVVAQRAGVSSHTIVPLGSVLRGDSPLTTDNELELYDSYEQMKEIIGSRVETTFVPNRNALFMLLASSYAIEKDVYTICTGIRATENYPDCSRVFVDAFEKAVNISLPKDKQISFKHPLIDMDRLGTINFAVAMGLLPELAYTRSSYEKKEIPSFRDRASILREQGFLEANIADPLRVRLYREKKINLPRTSNYENIR